MISIAICDDDIEIHKLLINYFTDFQKDIDIDFKIQTFLSGEELLDSDCNNFNIIFLDMEMKTLNGIETAKKIRLENSHVNLIFISAYIQYAIEGYSVNAYRFLIKPITYDKFLWELKELILKLNSISEEYLHFFHKGNNISVLKNSIMYIEIIDHSLQIHYEDKVLSLTGSLKMVEQELLGYNFARIHNSYVVNLDYITSIKSTCVLLNNTFKLPISRSKQHTFKKIYAQYWSEKMA